MKNFNDIGEISLEIFTDEDYFLNKLFVTLYNGIPYEQKIMKHLKTQKAAEYIIEKYNLKNKPEQIRYYKQSQRKKSKDLIIIGRNTKSKNAIYYIIIKERLIIKIDDYSVIFVFDDTIELSEILKLEEGIMVFEKKKKKKKCYFYMITKDFDGFGLNKYKIKNYSTDISLHYNDDFQAFDSSAIEFLQDKHKSGLLLMHGLSGTGKTTYIRYLINNVKQKFIFLPLYMAEALSSPELLPFLTAQKNSIIIIEDSEKLIANRESGNTDSGIATLLNLSDGLMSDALGIKIICTFNTGLSNIDKALLRKGRLINRYEFRELSIEKARKIAEINSLPYDGKSPITIGNLFNIETNNQTNEISKKSIGFKR